MAPDPKMVWFGFYPNDHRADPGLALCSMAARGLWFEMLCLMYVAEPRGYLARDGVAMSTDQLARLTGQREKDVKKWLSELGQHKVFSIDATGIFSRRILRDDAKREERRQNGRKGGSPLLKGTHKLEVNLPVKMEDKAQRSEAKDQSPDAIIQKPNFKTAGQVSVSVPIQAHQGTSESNENDKFSNDVLDLVHNLIPVSEANPAVAAAYMEKWLGKGWHRSTILETIKSILGRPREESKKFSFEYFETVLEDTHEKVRSIKANSG